MPTYFFDTEIDGKSSLDEDGTELPDLARVKTEARVALCELAAEVETGLDATMAKLSVRNDTGEIVLAVSLELKVLGPLPAPA